MIIQMHFNTLQDIVLTVGSGAAVALPNPSATFNDGTGLVPKKPDNIMVQADPGNSGIITLGPTSVADPISNTNRAIRLSAGATMNLPKSDLGYWYAIASANGQRLNVQYQAGID